MSPQEDVPPHSLLRKYRSKPHMLSLQTHGGSSSETADGNTCWGGCREFGTFRIADGNGSVKATWEKVVQVLKILDMKVPSDLVIPLRSVYPRELNQNLNTNVYSSIIRNSQASGNNSSVHPRTDGWIKWGLYIWWSIADQQREGTGTHHTQDKPGEYCVKREASPRRCQVAGFCLCGILGTDKSREGWQLVGGRGESRERDTADDMCGGSGWMSSGWTKMSELNPWNGWISWTMKRIVRFYSTGVEPHRTDAWQGPSWHAEHRREWVPWPSQPGGISEHRTKSVR